MLHSQNVQIHLQNFILWGELQEIPTEMNCAELPVCNIKAKKKQSKNKLKRHKKEKMQEPHEKRHASLCIDLCGMEITMDQDEIPKIPDLTSQQQNDECNQRGVCTYELSRSKPMCIPGLFGTARLPDDGDAKPTIAERKRLPHAYTTTGKNSMERPRKEHDKPVDCTRNIREVVHSITSDKSSKMQSAMKGRRVISLGDFLEGPSSNSSFSNGNSFSNLKEAWNDYRDGCDTRSIMPTNQRRDSLNMQLSNIRRLIQDTRSVRSDAARCQTVHSEFSAILRHSNRRRSFDTERKLVVFPDHHGK